MAQASNSRLKRLQVSFALVFCFSLFIILWGAWVRISGSGDGCGSHWPFCHGEIIPRYRDMAMLIENFHRMSSKAFGFLIIGLWIYIFKAFQKPHPLRRFIVVVFCLTLIEGLLGALLVLGGFVGQEASVGRAVVMALHLLNTFLLMGSIALCWLEARQPQWRSAYTPPQTNMSLWMGLALIVWVLVSSTGALAALASTLFPSTSLIEGLQKDFSSASHFSLRLRLLHPFLAVAFIGGAFYYLQSLKVFVRAEWLRKVLVFTQSLLIVNLIAGFVTLGLLSPTWMKLIHLILIHLIWIGLCLSFFPLIAAYAEGESSGKLSRFIGRS